MDGSMVEALGRVYSAAYSASGVHAGAMAMTNPIDARRNAEEACQHFMLTLAGLRIKEVTEALGDGEGAAG